MHLILMILLMQSVNMNKIEDGNTLYLMDKDVSYYDYSWVRSYIADNYGFRTSGGCLDVERWHQVYDAKARLPAMRSFDVDYFFYKRDGYNWHIETHRLDFSYYRKLLKLTFSVSPNFYKRDDNAGIGVGFYKSNLKNLQLFLNLKDFDHNYSTDRVYSDTIHDPYVVFPFQLELRGNYVTNRGYLNFDITNTKNSIKKILFKDSLLGFNDERDYNGRMFAAVNVTNNFVVSTYSVWRYYRSEVDSFNYHSENTIGTSFISLAFDYTSGTINYHLSLPLYHKYNKTLNLPSGNTDYNKYMYGLTIGGSKKIEKFTTLGILYQRGIRKRIIDDSTYAGGWGDLENRLVVSLEFKFNDKTFLKVNEGLELDNFPHIPITRLHNHTYVLIQYTP